MATSSDADEEHLRPPVHVALHLCPVLIGPNGSRGSISSTHWHSDAPVEVLKDEQIDGQLYLKKKIYIIFLCLFKIIRRHWRSYFTSLEL